LKGSRESLAHGYAFTPNALFDPDWKEEEKPWVIGRKRFGSIAIANSDAGADAYTNVAIDQAHRPWRSWQRVGANVPLAGEHPCYLNLAFPVIC